MRGATTRARGWPLSLLVLCAFGCAAPEDVTPPVPRAPREPGRVAVIKSSDREAYEAPIAEFVESLGQPVHIYDLKGRARERYGREVVEHALAADPPLLFVIGLDALEVARDVARGTPIVFAMVINWKDHGLMGVPNITGVALEVPPEVQFTQLKIIAPSVHTIGVIHGSRTQTFVDLAQSAAEKLGVELKEALVSAPPEVPRAWKSLRGEIDALWMVPDATAVDAERFRYLKEATQEAKVPFMGFSDKFVRAGCLMSLSADYEAIGSQAGILASRILDGEIEAGPHGVELPVGTILSINLETAAIIGLDVEDEVLDLVDVVIDPSVEDEDPE